MKSEDATSAYDELPDLDHAGVDWQDLSHAVRERLWMVILVLVLSIVAAAVYFNGQKQAYRARSVLFIEQELSKYLDPNKGGQEVHNEAIQSLDMINTVVDKLRSFTFAERVATRVKLQQDPRFLAGLGERPATPLSAADAGAILRSHVTSEYRQRTRLIDIFVTLPEPSLATDVANAYADEYIRYGFDRKADVNLEAKQYLMGERERLGRELKTAEEAMQSFRERNNATGSLDEMQASGQTKINDLSKSISDTDKRILELDNDLKVAALHPADATALLSLPSVASQPRVAELNQQIAELERQFTLLKQRYRAKHPLYIQMQTQLASLTRDRNQVLQDVVGLLRGARGQMQASSEQLKAARDAQQKQLLSTTGKTVEYNELKRAVDNNKMLYDAVTQRIAQIGMTEDSTASPVQVHERAVSAGPVRVNPVKVFSLAVSLGLLGGLGLALSLHFLDRSIKTIDQAERLAGVPVLTAVPRKKRRGGGNSLDMVSDREGIVAESFRTLRTSLAMTASADDRRSFMFTSAVPSEGKTFCSSNFSVTLAQQGFKTLLIDGDLRRPTVSRVFFGEQRKPGLVDILAGQCTLRDALQDTETQELQVVTAGSRAPNPAELLTAAKINDLLKEAFQTYDRVVIDTAPVLAVSDALLIAPHMDVTCLVLRSFKTPRKTFGRAIKALDDIDCRPVGVVFNFMPTGFGSYYYYSGKYHGDYGTKGVYGT